MYMMYETKQFSDYKKQKRYITINSYKQNEGLHRYPQPPQRFPTALPKPPFMPSKLIRTSDMKLVPGSTVNEGYCALSYTWNQLGDHTTINKNIGKTIEHKDLGKHKIIFPAYTVRQKPRGRKRIRRKVRFVTFEGLIQRICKDFNIKYIWYDQTCINQRDRKEKQGQLHGRHLIYSNAYCTLALIPEFQVKSENVIVRKNNSNLQTINSKSTERISKYRRYFISNKHIFDSQWMKNTWTMQEVLSSKRLLLIGQNVHSWRYQPKDIIIINDKPDHLTM
ncbi:heterokaryon incompatibility protein-domain-containing protein, partial [Phascolomyces articulosus]